ncbi:hypothetical protein BLNAU_9657 [Blattamonas nauphoetae]|uniref:Uncharacterized protein n=1 Tax=Blattamonas nauphoetae TaxID=2049346 RepID=A0ABQ9XVB4_9EUKA|nr:hypothetical protein BLNAU_9657 [Blattamonas nauphoetae]
MFSASLTSDTANLFLCFPPPLVIRFFLPLLWAGSEHDDMVAPLKLMLTTLVLVTAPSGDCLSLKELYRSVRDIPGMKFEWKVNVGVCEEIGEHEHYFGSDAHVKEGNGTWSEIKPYSVISPASFRTLHSARLMEWFVEAVIGTELLRNEHPSAPPLTFENIRIDSSSTIVITFPSSPDEPSISGSLSSDISSLCSFFLHIHRTFEQHNRLILPLDPAQSNIVFARIMVALVEQFVASGDLILPNSSPTDHSQYFADYCRDLDRTADLSSDPFRLHNLTASFTRLVLHTDDQNSIVLPSHSFLCGDAVEHSEQLLDAVKKIKETLSMEKVWNAFSDWLEWWTMMETIEKDPKLGTDLSFLQSSCFRATLLSLQTKHQLIANPPQIEENNESDSPPFWMPDDLSLRSQAISAFTNLTFNLHSTLSHQTSSTRSSSHASTISTQTSFPSDHCPPIISHSLSIHYFAPMRQKLEVTTFQAAFQRLDHKILQNQQDSPPSWAKPPFFDGLAVKMMKTKMIIQFISNAFRFILKEEGLKIRKEQQVYIQLRHFGVHLSIGRNVRFQA